MLNNNPNGDAVLKAIVLLSVLVLCMFIVTIVWNNIMPDIFNLPKINILQAFGMFVIINILFRFKVTKL